MFEIANDLINTLSHLVVNDFHVNLHNKITRHFAKVKILVIWSITGTLVFNLLK